MKDLDINTFRDIQVSDREILNRILEPENKMLCSYNFSNLYIWGDIYKTKWKIFKERLLIYNSIDDFLYMPAGRDFEVRELLEISDAFIAQKKGGNFMFASADYIEKNKDIASYFRAEPDRDNADYIYSTRKLVEMKGKKLHRKKNLISQFLRNNPGYVLRKLEQQFFKDCFELAEKWCKIKNCNQSGYTHETSALKRAFDNFKELELEGLVIFVRDRIVAFSIFDRQNRNTADLHFEKYDPEIKGSEQVICWETAKYLLDRYEYLNREEDMGIGGLRQAKISYDPEYLLITYRLYRKENVPASTSQSEGGRYDQRKDG